MAKAKTKTKAKAKTKTAKKAKLAVKAKVHRKRCANAGCRRLASKSGGPVCDECGQRNPMLTSQRTTALKAAQWSAIDLEMRNALQGIEMHKKDMQIAAHKYNEDLRQRLEVHNNAQQARRNEIAGLERHIAGLETRYKQLTDEIAENAGLLGRPITIDPDTCIVRELIENKGKQG